MTAFPPNLASLVLGNLQPVSKGDYKAAMERSGSVFLQIAPNSKLTLGQIGGILHNPATTADRARQLLAGLQVVGAQVTEPKTRADIGTVAQYFAQKFLVATNATGLAGFRRALESDAPFHGHISARGSRPIEMLGELHGGGPDFMSCAWAALGTAASMMGCPDLDVPLPAPSPERVREAAKVFPNAARLLNQGFAARDTATISRAVTALRKTRAMAILQTWSTPHDAVIHPALHHQMSAATTLLLAAATQAKATEMPAAGHIAARCVFGLADTGTPDFGDFAADDGASAKQIVREWIEVHESWGRKTANKTPSGKSQKAHADRVNSLKSRFEASLGTALKSDTRAKIVTSFDAVGASAQDAAYWDSRLSQGLISEPQRAETRERIKEARQQKNVFTAELMKMLKG